MGIRTRPLVLIIRDGWGYQDNKELWEYDATRQAKTPVDDELQKRYSRCLIATSGEDVGLPAGTMGNSEVGHQNLGAGRIVYQESMRLTRNIREGGFFENEVLLKAMACCREKSSKLHLFGLVSNAGVHSLLEHLYGLLELAKRSGLRQVYLHAFTDGRDTPPRSGLGFLEQVESKMSELGIGQVASVMGRFWAMDRDQRWERIEKAYSCLCYGKGNKAQTVQEVMQASYRKDVTDEFVEPTCLVNEEGHPRALVEEGDAVVFFNFRGDRPRQLTRAFVDEGFTGFARVVRPEVYYVCMTRYDATIPAAVAFDKCSKMKHIAGDYLSGLGLKQFRCAETEKYAHVTFFFNDYTEPPFKGEDRQIVPSPKVRTYDLQPEMSAYKVTDTVLERLSSGKYDFMLLNYANCDMVGHTGVIEAAVKAAEVVDECVGKVLKAIRKLGGSAIVTADHGNLEQMYDPDSGCSLTSHTTYPVPLYVVDEKYGRCKLRQDGRLADVVPTAFHIMALAKPEEMTGTSLIIE